MNALMKIAAIAAFIAVTAAAPRWRDWGASADSQGQSYGAQSNVNTRSDVRNSAYGSNAFSSGSGSAYGRGQTAVDLMSRAGVGGREGRGYAGSNAYGNQVSSSAGANAADVDHRRIAVGGSGSSSFVSTRGNGGSRSYAGAENNYAGINGRSYSSGNGELVVGNSGANVGLLNEQGSAKVNGYVRASGRRYSQAESNVGVRRQG